jgi:O-methyltransferase involved in polyketide biosynthesis
LAILGIHLANFTRQLLRGYVTMYLSAQAVDSTLNFIRCRAVPGSRAAFDYIYASVLRRENRYYGKQELFETVSKTGEGWTFGLEDGAIESFLAERGFEIVAHYTPPELEKLWLQRMGCCMGVSMEHIVSSSPR